MHLNRGPQNEDQPGLPGGSKSEDKGLDESREAEKSRADGVGGRLGLE